MLVSGHGIADRGRRGERLFDDDFLLLVNAHDEPVDIVLPHSFAEAWQLVVDTAVEPPADAAHETCGRHRSYPLQGRSLALLRRARPLQ